MLSQKEWLEQDRTQVRIASPHSSIALINPGCLWGAPVPSLGTAGTLSPFPARQNLSTAATHSSTISGYQDGV